MTLQEVNNLFEGILKTRCDELLVDQTNLLYRNAGMLREILWRYKSYTFWVEYMHFEALGGQVGAYCNTPLLLKDVVIPLKLKFKTDDEAQWAACDVIEEFLEFLI
ncbi:MAG TPA: hypothetical protein VI387_10905 [Candidatus Brocadiales bacterium]|nr:hypothetical protein [Candidatus Brocadiales bacterium]